VPTTVPVKWVLNAPLADRRGEYRTEPVPPEPHRLVTDIDPPLEQQVLDLPQRQRIGDVHQHRETDHARGVSVRIPDRSNSPAERLRADERISGQGHITGTHRSLALQLEVNTDYYFEEGELEVKVYNGTHPA
jgi:hypothetical protein